MTFDEWISNVFDHPVRQPHWEGQPSYWEGPASAIVEYMTRLFAEAERVLDPFSDAQAAQGLYAVIGNGPTDYPFMLLDTSVPLHSRLDCIQAMEILFRRYFSLRCTPHLSHLDKVKTPSHVSALNSVCYMWWDVLPLHGLSHHRPTHPDGEIFDSAILSVIRQCLELDSLACQESALLGLMKWSPYFEETSEIADDFLSRKSDISPELQAFAYRLL